MSLHALVGSPVRMKNLREKQRQLFVSPVLQLMASLGLGAGAVPHTTLHAPNQDCCRREVLCFVTTLVKMQVHRHPRSLLRLKNTGKMLLLEEPPALSSHVLMVVARVSLQRPQWPQTASECW